MEFLPIEYLTIKQNWTRWDPKPNNPKDIFWFEKVDMEFWHNFSTEFWWLVYLITIAYWVGVHFCQHLMKNRSPMDNLSYFMFTYNVTVGAFSLIALWRISPLLFYNFSFTPEGIHNSMCNRPMFYTKDAFWLVATGLFKFVHFLDTFYLVLRKKPIEYIQMYHHSLAVIVPPNTFPFGEPFLVWLGITNHFQHAITYPFFACKLLKMKVPEFVSSIVVVVELLQLIIGTSIGLYTSYISNYGYNCLRHPKSILVFNFGYVTMFILVLYMTYDHFIVKNKLKNTKID